MLTMYGSELVKPFKSGERILLQEKCNFLVRLVIKQECSGKRRAHIRGIIYGLTNAYFLFSCEFRLSFDLLLVINPLHSNVQNSFRCNCLLRWSLDDAEHCGLGFDSDCHHEGASRLFGIRNTVSLQVAVLVLNGGAMIGISVTALMDINVMLVQVNIFVLVQFAKHPCL